MEKEYRVKFEYFDRIERQFFIGYDFFEAMSQETARTKVFQKYGNIVEIISIVENQ